MEKKLRVLVLGLIALAACSVSAIADDASCDMSMEKEKMSLDEMFFNKAKMIKAHSAALGLNEDQLQKISMLKTNVKKAMIQNDADIKVLVIDLEALLGKDEIEVAAVNSLIDKKYAVKIQEAKMLVSSLADLKKVLTKDQMAKLHELWGTKKMEGAKDMKRK